MFRIALIVLATALAGATIVLAHQIPVRVDMKAWTQVLVGISFFFMLFFVVIRFVDDYFWWAVPAAVFIITISFSARRLSDINRLIAREKPNLWLRQTAGSLPITGAPVPMTAEELQAALAAFDTYHEEHPEPQERRFLDDFAIADEADLGPQEELDLEHLDSYIFTARHGYLVHHPDAERVPCDVMTIHPGMSIADLIDVAKLHECTKETV